MPVEIDIAKVASLARIALSEEELAVYGEQLGAILEHAERVQQLPTAGIPPTSHPVPMTNSFRADEVTGSLTPDEALSGAPAAEDGYFKVPPVLGEE